MYRSKAGYFEQYIPYQGFKDNNIGMLYVQFLGGLGYALLSCFMLERESSSILWFTVVLHFIPIHEEI